MPQPTSTRSTWLCSFVKSVKEEDAKPNNVSALPHFFSEGFFGFGVPESNFDLSSCASKEEIAKRIISNHAVSGTREKSAVDQYWRIAKEAKDGDRVFLASYEGVICASGVIVEAYRYNDISRAGTDFRSKFAHSISVKWTITEAFYPWKAWQAADFTKPREDYMPNWDTEEADFIERRLRDKLKLNKIYTGAPGTGKTYRLKPDAVDACLRHDDPFYAELEAPAFTSSRRDRYKRKFDELVKEGRIELVTFHQSYDYTDFVQGIRPALSEKGGLRYEMVKGPLWRIANAAMRSQEAGSGEGYVLLIDEINRGNVSKIFGELITLLEESYRINGWEAVQEGHLVALAGGQVADDDVTSVCDTFKKSARFGLPANLSIFGTMNSTDRSIQRLDSALRRRFDFIEVLPDPTLLSDNLALKDFLEKINAALEVRKPGSGCQIGHAWLMLRGVAIPPSSVRLLCEAFNNKIFPLLSEWFWDDPDGLMKMFGGASALVDLPSRRIRSLVEKADESDDASMTPDIFLRKFKEKYRAKNSGAG
jgi:hypothetical protein